MKFKNKTEMNLAKLGIKIDEGKVINFIPGMKKQLEQKEIKLDPFEWENNDNRYKI